MCGIAGVVNHYKKIDAQEKRIDFFSKSLNYRGPNETGYYQDDYTILLNNRFSIIGKNNGSQPFYDDTKEIISVYNGEIYNFQELKDELVKDGVIFYKDTDGEVIPHLYKKYGNDFINKLNGEYAIAVFDKKKKELFLGRDRFGVRPLFYSLNDEEICFSSEAKAMLPFLTNVSLSKSSIFSFAQCSFLKSPLSFFEGVFQIEAGCYGIFNSDSCFKTTRYWELPLDQEKNQVSEKDALMKIKNILVDSVKLRLQSDVPVGVFLSGGIDSSIIAKIVSDLNSKVVESFTIDFTNKSFSESQKAKDFAKECNLNHSVYIHHDEDAVKNFPRMIYHTESILNTGSPMAFYGLAEFAKKKVDVILGGEGADEVFCGYGFQNIELKKQKLQRWYLKPFMFIVKLYLYYKDQLNDYFPPEKEIKYVEEIFGKFSPGLQFFARKGEKMLTMLKLKNVDVDEEKLKVRKQFDYFIDFSKKLTEFDYMTFIDFRTWLENHLLLINGDRPTMATTIESRYPYLDYRLVEYVCQLPSSLKVNSDISKFLLRSIQIDGLNKKIMDRKKVPFLAPACKPFFDENLKEKYKYIEYMTSENTILKKGYFDSDVLVNIIEELSWFHSNKVQKKEKSYGDLHFKESVFMTVLSVNLLDEIFIKGNNVENILNGKFYE